MAKIKAFSDISQSKTLAEILPLESADAFYPWRELMKDYDSIYVPEEMLMSDLEEDDICAWSLAALLGVLPTLDGRNAVLCKDIRYDEWHICYHSTATLSVIDTERYDNPVDACYEMILKLHELKML